MPNTFRSLVLLIVLGLGATAPLVFSTMRGHRPEAASAVLQAIHTATKLNQSATTSPQSQDEFDRKWNAALTTTDPATRRDLLEQWASLVSISDMEEVLAQIDNMEDPTLRAEVQDALLTSWVERDKDSLAAWFGAGKGGQNQHRGAQKVLLLSLFQHDSLSSLLWMQRSMSGLAQNELYQPFFEHWAKTNPAGACARLSELAFAPQGNPRLLNSLFSEVIGQWAQADPASAMNWAQSLPQGAAKSQALLEVDQQLAETNPQLAATYAVQQNDSDLLASVAGKWTQSDPAAAAKWASGLASGAARDAAMASVANAWAQKDPAAAATFAAGLPPGDAQKRAVLGVVSVWAYAAPDQAAQWISQFPEGDERTEALELTIGAWAGTNADEAGQWLRELPVTPSRDFAVSTYVGALSTSSPNIAFAWAGTIANDHLRSQQQERSATAWLRSDPTSAKLAIAQANLPATTKRQLLSTLVQ